MSDTCPCCASNGRLPQVPIVNTPYGVTQAVPGDIVKTMCDDCIWAAFLAGGTAKHPHPFDNPAVPQQKDLRR